MDTRIPTAALLGTTVADRRRAIVFMVLATAAFAIASALAKLQMEKLPVAEVVFFRSALAWIPVIATILLLRRPPRTSRLREHLTRGVLGFLGLLSMFMALNFISLTNATAISYASPLILSLLAVPMLGEKLRLSTLVVLCVGMAGVLLMFPLDNSALTIGGLFALANAVFGAFVSIAVRKMSLSEPPLTLVFYQLGTGTILSLPLLGMSGFVMPDLAGWLALIGIGALSASGQYCWANAFRHGAAGTVAPFIYASLLWVVLFDWILWDEWPSLSLAAGAALVIICAIYALYRQAGSKANAS